jgi:hypothetical protein
MEYWDENRFAFLGNGFDTREFDGRDITNYLGLLGEEDKQPEYDEKLIDTLGGVHIDPSYYVNAVVKEKREEGREGESGHIGDALPAH